MLGQIGQILCTSESILFEERLLKCEQQRKKPR